MPYEIGDIVRPSATYLKYRHKKGRDWYCRNGSQGIVTGYGAPKLINGEHIGVVKVVWEGTSVAVPMRWDQIEPSGTPR